MKATFISLLVFNVALFCLNAGVLSVRPNWFSGASIILNVIIIAAMIVALYQ